MDGKVVKIASNDLYGDEDDRIVKVYACFEHTKYMNNYVVFSIDGNDKLCFGSMHIKDNSLIIFSVKKEIEKYILNFLDEYMSDKIDNFKIININNINKVQLVSYNEIEYDKIGLLEDKSIPKNVEKNEDEKEKKPVLIYILIFILLILAIGISVLYFKPELFSTKYKVLECINNLYDNDIKLYYDIKKEILFDEDDSLDSISVTRTYTFLDSNSYYEFKDNGDELSYFNNGEKYKYIDKELKLRLFYNEDSVIDSYDEMFVYMKREGYTCVVKEYEK